MSDVIIRAAKQEDIDSIVHLCELHAHFEGAEYDSEGKHQKLSKLLFQEVPQLHCLVAERVAEKNNELLGYATATKELSTWDADFFLHMDCLYILEKSRGEKLGYKFISEIKNLAKELKCTHVQWQTPISNTGAIGFYKKCGAASKDKVRFFLSI
jgi:GNAT superfamily N-acetyltransferase